MALRVTLDFFLYYSFCIFLDFLITLKNYEYFILRIFKSLMAIQKSYYCELLVNIFVMLT